MTLSIVSKHYITLHPLSLTLLLFQPTQPRTRARATDISVTTGELTSCSQTPSPRSASSPPSPASPTRSSRAARVSPAAARRETAASWATGATCRQAGAVYIFSPGRRSPSVVNINYYDNNNNNAKCLNTKQKVFGNQYKGEKLLFLLNNSI